MIRRSLVSVAVACVGLSLFACGGVWDQAMSQAGVENLTEARGKVELCTGDGQEGALASLDTAIQMAASGQVGFSELVFFEVAIDEAIADGDISATEATTIATRVGELGKN